MLIEYTDRDNGSTLSEVLRICLSILTDSSLLLAKRTMLLPDHVLVVKMMQKQRGPWRPFDQDASYKSPQLQVGASG